MRNGPESYNPYWYPSSFVPAFKEFEDKINAAYKYVYYNFALDTIEVMMVKRSRSLDRIYLGVL